MQFRATMTERNQKLYDSLMKRSLGDRSKEWIRQSELADIAKKYKNEAVMVRRARAIEAMLQALTDESISKRTHTADIDDEELLLGRLTMGSNGLGKVFPNCLTEDEKRAGSVTNRSSLSLLGHNTLDYTKLVNHGLEQVIQECKIKEIENSKIAFMRDSLLQNEQVINHQKHFYRSVRIACQAVIDYAEKLADIAESKAKQETNDSRAKELVEMARIARKVPRYGADTFREAIQSIWIYHVSLHASMNLISFGRLDQVLNPFLEKAEDKDECLEIFEQFIIKAAWRLNLNMTTDVISKQDHVDYATVLGVNPYLIDQKAGVNNFLQNIIVGGLTPEGKDATNDATFLILQAFSNVNLSTPGIYVRLGSNSSRDLINKVAEVWERTKNNPAIINDDIMIPAMKRALSQGVENMTQEKQREIERVANDYCVDGCWEPILNGKSDWTFTMLNALTPLECALNGGALLTDDPELLRGAKKAPTTEFPRDFEELMDNFEKQLGFFIDQSVISLFLYYMMDEYACPSPLLSAYLDGCMEKGRDKSWGGAAYNIGGVILGAVPNVVNTLSAIKTWVYPEKGKGKYDLKTVIRALKADFKCSENEIMTADKYRQIKNDFAMNTPYFGTQDEMVYDITKRVLDIYSRCVERSAKFAKRVYEDAPKPEDRQTIIGIRSISGYYGYSLEEKFGDFNMHITAGLGTFEQYNWMGRASAASADRAKGAPIAPNFSPVSGTASQGMGGILQTVSKCGLERFAAGSITDTCLEVGQADINHLADLVQTFIKYKGGMMTLAIGDKELYQEIYDKAIVAQQLNSEEKYKQLLREYADVNVRIGGWQTPFITLPLSHMANYVERPTKID